MRKKTVVAMLAVALTFSLSACSLLEVVQKGILPEMIEALTETEDPDNATAERESDSSEEHVVIGDSSEESEPEDVVTESEPESESGEEAETEEQSQAAGGQEDSGEQSQPETEGNVISLSTVSFTSEKNAYVPLDVKANAPEYSVASDLSNIENIDQFSNLTPQQRQMIAENGFVVIPTEKEQLFYIYEDNTYKQIPSFITSDSVLQLYHIYYDYALRNVENDYFCDEAITMNTGMLQTLMKDYDKATDPKMKDIVAKDLSYFAVAGMLLDQELPDELDQTIKETARAEYDLIMDAGSTTTSPILGVEIDYTLFTVRGHYTRSEELEKYFRAFIWYGIAPFTLTDNENNPTRDSALCALTVSSALNRSKKAKASWKKIYSTTGFMVGQSDDLTPLELIQYVKQTLGKIPEVDEWPGQLDEVYANLDSLRAALIVSKQESASKGLQMRFMGQRYIPDSEILQKLCHETYRPYPTGLDVLAVYGSEQAEKLLDEIYRPTEVWPGYADEYKKLTEKFRSQSVAEQTSNVYTTWLYTLNQIGSTKGEGYPMFMQNEAWRNKCMTTALGSWAELRHDTILYGKQSGAECGGGEEPPQIMSYVEPDPEFYNRLYWLTETTRAGLEDRGMLSRDMEYKTDSILRLLDFLRTCATKELNGEDLSAEERYSLLVYGGTLEYISSSIADADGWYMIENETDKNMAVAADVHTTLQGYLEETVGYACEIYVAIPQDGKVYLTRGAVFDYYEFVSPVRLQDETWQNMLKEGAAPERVPYAGTFLNEEGAQEVPVPDQPYSTGC